MQPPHDLSTSPAARPDRLGPLLALADAAELLDGTSRGQIGAMLSGVCCAV